MLSAAYSTTARPVLMAAVSQTSGARNMATLKESNLFPCVCHLRPLNCATVSMRLKSVSNIAKITKSMKMIASTKVARAQRTMESARAYGSSFSGVSLFCFALACADMKYLYEKKSFLSMLELFL